MAMKLIARKMSTVICSMVAAVAMSSGAAAAVVTSDDRSDYVALGDSAAATPLPDAVTPSLGCLKSTQNYPAVLAQSLGNVDLIDVSCSGAKTSHVVDEGQPTFTGTVPSQIDAVGPDTDLITITIGGNDVDLVWLALSCITVLPPDQTSSTCSDRFIVDGIDTISAKIADQLPSWSAMIDAIKAKAPNARIVLVGYGTYIRPGGCYPTQPLHPKDADYLQTKVDELADKQSQIAADQGIDFFDTRPVTVGHDACAAPGDRYIEGLIPTRPAAPLHGNGAGAIAIGDALARYLS